MAGALLALLALGQILFAGSGLKRAWIALVVGAPLAFLTRALTISDGLFLFLYGTGIGIVRFVSMFSSPKMAKRR